MTEAMSCPHCGGRMQVTPEFRGKVVLCPHCRKACAIPAPAAQPTGPEAGVSPPAPVLATVPTHLAFAVLTTLLCCPALGIVAIIYSGLASSKLNMGDYAGAVAASRTARLWCWLTLVVGIIIQTLLVVGGFWLLYYHPELLPTGM